MQVPPGSAGATNANGWVYGLFELGIAVAIVVAIVVVVTSPIWVKSLLRPFGSLKDDDK